MLFGWCGRSAAQRLAFSLAEIEELLDLTRRRAEGASAVADLAVQKLRDPAQDRRGGWTSGRRGGLLEAFALSDPTRLSVAVALREADEPCVRDLAWILERAQNLVSHHLRALRAEGLVDYRREGKMALYPLTERGRAMLELPSRGRRRAPISRQALTRSAKRLPLLAAGEAASEAVGP